MYGSQLDHTILLASYFLHLGVRCWIVIGFGLPRGRSSYVLVKRHNDKPSMINENIKNGGFFSRNEPFTWCIYDAAAGEKYIVREVGCPLRTVSYVFDCDNVSPYLHLYCNNNHPPTRNVICYRVYRFG